MAEGAFTGLFAPALTPITAELGIDHARFARFCGWLMDEGEVDGLAIFGTTSEANSFSPSQRMEATDRLVASGIDASALMPGTGACALADTVALTAHAVEAGAGGVLMLPPFYYKIATDDGLFGYISEVIERVGDSRLKIYLYHIPPMAVVGYSLDLIGRLIDAYPDTVVGLKDSTGKWDVTKSIIDSFPGFNVFPGSEAYLLDSMKAGGAGCISASANVNGKAIRDLINNWDKPGADEKMEFVRSVRATIQDYPLIGALKGLAAHYTGDETWSATMPPLQSLPEDKRAELIGRLEAIGFGTGLAKAA